MIPLSACAQSDAKEEENKGPLISETFAVMELRNIGPALMSGRIAGIAIVPDDPATC